ncbi:unnamed protein product [Cuscuta europaea]|uniref:PB1 domain-containing protein n=1 Tax=Cuscuta europaea TaxID=41803 RepID=A0A9P1EDP2_CUSEU|nr:unnamed protein product [Cuscuta europaea]
MGKQSGKKKKQREGVKSGKFDVKKNQGNVKGGAGVYDEDMVVFMSMSRELKEGGNRLFQNRDYEGAMFMYGKAIKLLPGNHIDVCHLRSNMAACYMQIGLSEYPRAIHECNLALEVSPNYIKALLKRARCYEALDKLDLALRDVRRVLQGEPDNLMATEIAERVKATLVQKGIRPYDNISISEVPEYVEPHVVSTSLKASSKEKGWKNKSFKIEMKEEEAQDNKTFEKAKVEKGALGVDKSMNPKDKRGEDKKIKQVVVQVKCGGDKNSEDGLHVQKAKIKNVDKAKNKVVVDGEGKRERKKLEDESSGNKDRYSDAVEIKTEYKLVVGETNKDLENETSRRMVKLIFGEDIRCAHIPINCGIMELKGIIHDRFPSSKSFLMKYKDQEGDLVTITSSEELRWAETSSAVQHSSVRLYIVDVTPDQDPLFGKVREDDELKHKVKQNHRMANIDQLGRSMDLHNRLICIDDGIVHFAELFMNYVGFEFDTYLELQGVGMKHLHSEAMEKMVTSEEAQDLFLTAGEKFQEMAALALFHWGNVHMSRARRRVHLLTEEDKSGGGAESAFLKLKSAYVWAEKEYSAAQRRYEDALKIKPDFYEGVLALGIQQFEVAKHSWYYAISTNADLESWPSIEAFQLYNSAAENMERGMHMWEEDQSDMSILSKMLIVLRKMKLDFLFREISADEAADQAANMRSQINLLWGSMLYERSMMEFKLKLPAWQETLVLSVERLELAGASPKDIAVMVKSHCSSTTAQEGIGFNIAEIVEAWNEMHGARRRQRDVPSFRLEPLLQRRVPKLSHDPS